MKNFIKITTGILIMVIALIIIDCTTGTKTEGVADSTSVVVDTLNVVDTTNVDGGAVKRDTTFVPKQGKN